MCDCAAPTVSHLGAVLKKKTYGLFSVSCSINRSSQRKRNVCLWVLCFLSTCLCFTAWQHDTSWCTIGYIDIFKELKLEIIKSDRTSFNAIALTIKTVGGGKAAPSLPLTSQHRRSFKDSLLLLFINENTHSWRFFSELPRQAGHESAAGTVELFFFTHENII